MTESPITGISCRVAESIAEREAVYRFRYSVYVEEMKKPLASADHAREVITDDLDAYSTIL